MLTHDEFWVMRDEGGTVVVSILPFVRSRSDFTDDVTRIMGEAFDTACQELHSAQPLIVQEIMAKRIIAAARIGERDVRRLREIALAALGRALRDPKSTDNSVGVLPFPING